MEIEKIIGERVREYRELRGLNQPRLGELIGELVGKDGKAWPRQAVNAAERGGRQWTAAELVAVAHVLGTTVPRLLTPPPTVHDIELRPGTVVDRGSLQALAHLPVSEARAFERMRSQLRVMAAALSTIQGQQSAALAAVDEAHQALEEAEQVSAFVKEYGPNAAAAAE